MKTRIIGGSIAIVAIAGGLMFCGDEEIVPTDPTPDDRVVDNTPREAPEGEGPLVTIQLGALGTSTPTFWAVRIGDEWSRPPEYAGKVKVRLPKDEKAYAVAWACESTGETSGIQTTLVEATVGELPTLQARCSSEQGETVTIAGAIRNVNGQPATLRVGDKTQLVENEREARDVLFSTEVPVGTHSFVAQVGEGEKTRYAAARNVEVKAGVNVEIDVATGGPLTPKTWEITAEPTIDTRFGDATLWMGGSTRAYSDKLEVTDGGVMARVSDESADYVDLHADLHGAPEHSRARARFIARSDRTEPLPMPSLNFIGPTYVRLDRGFQVSWSNRNWAVFGRAGETLAVFMPVAFVATVEQTSPNVRFNLVVTPRRALGTMPYYKMSEAALSKIDGWEDRFWYDEEKTVALRAGNLTAWEGDDLVPDPAAAIAAYLDDEFTPADLGARDSLAVVLAGEVTMQFDDGSIEDMVDERCMKFRGCEDTSYDTAQAVDSCPDLEAFQDCEEINELPEPPPYFADALKRELARWYNASEIPNAVSLADALGNSSADNVETVDTPSAPNLRVVKHADPTRPDSGTTWYGAYLGNRLISVQPVNWDAKFQD